MATYNNIEEFIEARASQQHTPLVATIGFFDGVHLGHKHLLSRLAAKALEVQGKGLIITFQNHPLSVVAPGAVPPLLFSPKEKRRELERFETFDLIDLPFTPDLAQMDAPSFLRPLIAHAGLSALVLGYDNRFGKPQGGSLEEFDNSLESLGLSLSRVFPPYRLGEEVVSSSAIRGHIMRSDFERASRLLGRPYTISGNVNPGLQIGRTINYPTANLLPSSTDSILPPLGIYIAEVRLEKKVFRAMAYYGSKPTIDGEHGLGIEVFLLDYSGDLYGKHLELAPRCFLRKDRKFSSLQELARQLGRDEEETRLYFERHPLLLS